MILEKKENKTGRSMPSVFWPREMKNQNSGCDCEPTNEILVAKIKENMISEQYLHQLAAFFKILGDETRMKIVHSLAYNELCVSDIAVVVNMTKSAVSHQLKALKYMGLVKARKEGKNVFYSLDDEHVVDIVQKSLEHIKHRE